MGLTYENLRKGGTRTGAIPHLSAKFGIDRDVVSIGGDHNVVAVGNHGAVHQTVDQADNQWRLVPFAALGNSCAIFVLPVPEIPDRITNGLEKSDMQYVVSKDRSKKYFPSSYSL